MDKKKQQLTIPKFAWVLAAILVICIIFLIAFQLPFSKKIDTYNKDHKSATEQINLYKDYLDRADSVKADIDRMKSECSTKGESLYINASKTADDIRDMLKDIDYDLSSLSVTEGVPDSEGRVSATGDPLYATSISFSFTTTEPKLIETLKYFETTSDGAYKIKSLSLVNNVEADQGIIDVESSGDVSKEAPESQTASKAAPAEDLYKAEMSIMLYYFDMSQNQGATSSAESAESSAS